MADPVRVVVGILAEGDVHQRQDERVGASASVRVIKTDGVQVFEDDRIKRAPAMKSRRGLGGLSKA